VLKNILVVNWFKPNHRIRKRFDASDNASPCRHLLNFTCSSSFPADIFQAYDAFSIICNGSSQRFFLSLQQLLPVTARYPGILQLKIFPNDKLKNSVLP
jgi:hypothetical protein